MLSPETLNCTPEFVFPLADVIGEADRAVLFRNGAANSLTHPPVRVCDKFEPTTWLKLFEGPHQANVAFLNQVKKRHTPTTVAIGHMDDETQVGTDHLGFHLRETFMRALPDTACRMQSWLMWLRRVLRL